MNSGKKALEEKVNAHSFKEWSSGRHRARRLVAEFIGTSGLTFVLSGSAAILTTYGGVELAPFQFAIILSAIAALWLVAAIYFLGDISAHFNPAITLAFTLRGDMGWPMAGAYIFIQFFAAAVGSYVAACMFGYGGNLAAVIPHAGHLWTTVSFEAILTFGLVLLILCMTNGPKFDGSSIPLAVGAYVMSMGTMGGCFNGGSFNPARAFGPGFVLGDFSGYWVYPLGSFIGVLVAVAIAYFLRGPAKAQESQAAMGIPLHLEDS